MTREEHLLTILGEECNEVAQRVSKALRFGLQEIQPGQLLNNEERIFQELADLFCVIEILLDEGILSDNTFYSLSDIENKKAKIEKYLKYSKELGTLIETEE